MLAFLLIFAIGVDPASLEHDLRAQPANAAQQLELAQRYEKEGKRVPAMLAYLRFLSVEPEGKDALIAAGHVREIVNAAAIDTYAADEREMALRMAAASVKLPENRKASEFEKLQRQVALALAMFNDAAPVKDFTDEVNLPFFTGIGKQGLTDAFVAVALTSLKLKGADVWTSHHPADVEKAWQIVRNQRK